MTVQTTRAEREKFSYDQGTVYQESSKLQARFPHVFKCPNSERLESHFKAEIERGARGADILDYGCLDGRLAPYYASLQPRKITGIDISEKGIATARERHGQLATFHLGDAHAMPFADSSFDLVVGRSILHHLDFEIALKEIRRVLRPGGAAVFHEPLRDNPAAILIRRLTPRARTPDELPISAAQIRYADALFEGPTNHLFGNLISVPFAAATSLLPMSSNNLVLKMCDKIDLPISRTPLKYWMRCVVLSWSTAH